MHNSHASPNQTVFSAPCFFLVLSRRALLSLRTRFADQTAHAPPPSKRLSAGGTKVTKKDLVRRGEDPPTAHSTPTATVHRHDHASRTATSSREATADPRPCTAPNTVSSLGSCSPLKHKFFFFFSLFSFSLSLSLLSLLELFSFLHFFLCLNSSLSFTFFAFQTFLFPSSLSLSFFAFQTFLLFTFSAFQTFLLFTFSAFQTFLSFTCQSPDNPPSYY